MATDFGSLDSILAGFNKLLKILRRDLRYVSADSSRGSNDNQA